MKRSDSFEEVFCFVLDLKFVCYVGSSKGTIFFWFLEVQCRFWERRVRCPESKYPPWNFDHRIVGRGTPPQNSHQTVPVDISILIGSCALIPERHELHGWGNMYILSMVEHVYIHIQIHTHIYIYILISINIYIYIYLEFIVIYHYRNGRGCH